MVDYTHDVVIVGGGLVGASLACALGDSPLRVGIIEASVSEFGTPRTDDPRSIALSYGSHRIFTRMGLWQRLSTGATPIERIHVSECGHFGITRLDAREEGVDALGYVVGAHQLGQALWESLSEKSNVERFCPAQVTEVAVGAPRAEITLQGPDQQRCLRARLLVAADGSRSVIRERLGIRARVSDYRQNAVIATLTPTRPHANTAYERFTETGPLALLPRQGGRCALIWTVSGEHHDAVLGWSDTKFLQAIQERFGERLGRLREVSERQAYPLRLIQARELVRPRLALIGNAAHTLHPVAGQGFNLGLRDAAILAETILQARTQARDFGRLSLLRRYADRRRFDQRKVITFTHGLARLFSNSLTPLVLARNLGLLTLDLLPPAKHAFAYQAMGLAGRLPRLGRGLAP